MRTPLSLLATMLAITMLLAPAQGAAMSFNKPWKADPKEVATLVAPFEGEPVLSRAVATIFDFQIWDTLDVKPGANREILAGRIGWNEEWPPPVDTTAAVGLAKSNNGQLIVWGRVQRYGSDVIALPRLSLTAADSHLRPVQPEIWTIKLGPSTVQLDVPRTTTNLGVVRLSPAFVDGFSKPDALKLCTGVNEGCNTPLLERRFVALKQEGEWSRVLLTDGPSGWVRIPRITDAPTIVGAFVGGMIAYFRGDFSGAADRFQVALDAKALGPEEELKALALAVSAGARAGRDTAQLRERLMALDPYSQYAAKVVVMDRLEAMSRATDGPVRTTLAKEAKAALANCRGLFDKTDPWLSAVDAILE